MAGLFMQVEKLASSQFFHLCIQAALVTSSLVFVANALVSHAVDNRNGSIHRSLCSVMLTSSNGCLSSLHISANHGTQAGVVLATLFVLFRAFARSG